MRLGYFLGGVVVAFPPSQEHSRAGRGWESKDMGDQSLGQRNQPTTESAVDSGAVSGGMCVTAAAAERPDTEQQATSLPLAL